MAVMSSQHSEGVAFEQKAQPVPSSSDKMALDLDINGNSIRDETNVDSAPPDTSMNKSLDISPSADLSSSALDMNGGSDVDAYSAYQRLPAMDVSLESQSSPQQSSASLGVPSSSQLLSSATTEEQDLPTEHATSSLMATIDSEVDAASTNVTAPSTVPPIVVPRESDVRDTDAISPLAQADLQPGQQLSFDLNTVDKLSIQQTDEPVDTSLTAEDTSFSFDPSASDLPVQQSAIDSDLSSSSQPNPDQGATQEPTMSLADTEMSDAPEPPPTSKVSREREDDFEDEPSAKRTKTEEGELAAMVPEFSASESSAAAQNGQTAAVTSDVAPISAHEGKEIVKILKNVLRTHVGKNFRAPVLTLWPAFAEQYSAKVPNPIDLATIETKVKGNSYPSMGDLKADVTLLYDNAVLFNGVEHTVTKAALEVRDSILSKIATLPPEPPTVPKLPKKPKRSTPVADAPPRATPVRRPSRSAGKSTATPGSAPPAPTFALDPSTSTPLIRRDSNKDGGGRPKREIHPPKNKDLVYSVRPKSRKFATELKFCEEVLNEMKKAKYQQFASPFLVPVDPVALGIPNYFAVIKYPMDVSTVSQKLQRGAYGKAKDFETDVRLIFTNCYKYNPVGNPVREMGRQLEEVFENVWAKKNQWISDHTPAALSPSSTADTEDEESEEDDEPEQPSAPSGATQAALRLIEEQNKLITLMTAKKPDQGLISMQQDLVQIVQKRVAEEAVPPPKKAPRKAKVPKPAKKAAPTKKAGSAPNAKKAAGGRQKYLGTLEKEVISAGLTSLPDDVSGVVLELIKGDQPGVDVADDGTLELDIDLVSIPTLWKIHGLIMQHAPDVETMVKKQLQERDHPRALAKPPTKKKNKPMSKSEQERKIEHLRNSVQEFERHGSGSQEPVIPTVEQFESSGDDDSSDSEEE